jgi:hypothetical protein
MGRTKFSTSTALALAAVLLSSSTAAFVVAKVPKNSVGPKQLRTSAVTNKKIAKSAVSNSKIGKKAVTGSKVKTNTLTGTQIKESTLGVVPNAGFALSAGNTARLEGKGAANFVGTTRMAFGAGFATSVPATTVLSLPNLGVTVTTDGDADVDGSVIVNLPILPASNWFINSSDDLQMFSTTGGAEVLGPLADGSAVREITSHIWRSDTAAGIYLHCTFDTDNFTGARPLSCWAMST